MINLTTFSLDELKRILESMEKQKTKSKLDKQIINKIKATINTKN